MLKDIMQIDTSGIRYNSKFIEDSLMLKMFLMSVPVSVLINLQNGPNFATRISREVGSTYSHVYHLTKKFQDQGLVESHISGRIRVVSLTNKGKESAGVLKELLIKLHDINNKGELKDV